MLTEPLPTKESRQESVEQREKRLLLSSYRLKKVPISDKLVWRSWAETNARNYTSQDRLDWLHYSLSKLRPHRLCCFQEVAFYHRTSRSWHFWPKCFRGKSIPSHTPVLTQPVTQMYS